MNRSYKFVQVSLLSAALLAAPILWQANSAHAAMSDEQELVDRARIAVNDAEHDREFGTARDLARHARAVLIVPRLFKAGFFFGGEGGDAVLLARTGAGWSAPAFYTLASASFGLQIGAQESEVLLFIMTQKALDAVMQNEFKIGADAGLAVVTLGSSAEIATTTALRADIVVWASSTGAYAGISLNGSVIAPRPSFNREYYGQDVTPGDILLRHDVSSPEAHGLQAALSNLG
jgi:lipid-binding SYLF domain-containing protein